MSYLLSLYTSELHKAHVFFLSSREELNVITEYRRVCFDFHRPRGIAWKPGWGWGSSTEGGGVGDTLLRADLDHPLWAGLCAGEAALGAWIASLNVDLDDTICENSFIFRTCVCV